jgi:hypothetical protein
MVCSGDSCCQRVLSAGGGGEGVFEGEAFHTVKECYVHSQECGGGLGVFLLLRR